KEDIASRDYARQFFLKYFSNISHAEIENSSIRGSEDEDAVSHFHYPVAFKGNLRDIVGKINEGQSLDAFERIKFDEFVPDDLNQVEFQQGEIADEYGNLKEVGPLKKFLFDNMRSIRELYHKGKYTLMSDLIEELFINFLYEQPNPNFQKFSKLLVDLHKFTNDQQDHLKTEVSVWLTEAKKKL
ncbi:MAG: hypothetical protein LW817_04330, partial [Candidatus Caenarcaniphilales bacterium]|nr:hypothetical protein [Candidatus Caenarcaniphilales bacterium]